MHRSIFIYHTNSWQTEQKVGCGKKVAVNSWHLTLWILACLMAPLRWCKEKKPSVSQSARSFASGGKETEDLLGYPVLIRHLEKMQLPKYWVTEANDSLMEMNIFKKYHFLKPTRALLGWFFIYHSYKDTKMTLNLGLWAPLNIHSAAFEM